MRDIRRIETSSTMMQSSCYAAAGSHCVIRLVYPYALLLLVFVPLLFVLSQRRQRPMVIGYSAIQELRTLPPTALTRLHRLLPVLRLLVLILGIIALSRPQWGLEAVRLRREGIAIDMVIDISRSMAAQDLQLNGQRHNRLEVVKKAFRGFVQGHPDQEIGREGDMIGMVTFARYADSISPLTLEHDLLLALLDRVEIVTLPEDNGTSIGEAIALGVERLRASSAKSRVMILLTDGSNNAGVTEPMEAARIAHALGIKIYTIGTGSHGMAQIALQTRDGRIIRQQMRVSIDEGTLGAIAALTGGKYFRATDQQALQAIYAEIDRLEKSTTVAEHYQQYIDCFPYVLLLALGFLLLEVVLVNTRLRTIP